MSRARRVHAHSGHLVEAFRTRRADPPPQYCVEPTVSRVLGSLRPRRHRLVQSIAPASLLNRPHERRVHASQQHRPISLQRRFDQMTVSDQVRKKAEYVRKEHDDKERGLGTRRTFLSTERHRKHGHWKREPAGAPIQLLPAQEALVVRARHRHETTDDPPTSPPLRDMDVDGHRCTSLGAHRRKIAELEVPARHMHGSGGRTISAKQLIHEWADERSNRDKNPSGDHRASVAPICRRLNRKRLSYRSSWLARTASTKAGCRPRSDTVPSRLRRGATNSLRAFTLQ